jgi:hypothetical protein
LVVKATKRLQAAAAAEEYFQGPVVLPELVV